MLEIKPILRTLTAGDTSVEDNADPRPPMAIFELLNYIVNEVSKKQRYHIKHKAASQKD